MLMVTRTCQTPVERICELGGEGNTSLLLEQSLTRNQSIEEQQQKRPLAKLQHDLEQMHEHRHDSDSKSESGSDDEVMKKTICCLMMIMN